MSQKCHYPLPKRPGDIHHIGQLTGSALSLVCAELSEQHAGLLVIITADMQQALRLQTEITQFASCQVNIFTDWETLPYDSFSPHQDVISERLSLLYKLPLLSQGILIVAINTLMQKVCPATFLTAHALVMRKGDSLSREQLRIQLEQAGYRSVSQVMAPGEFATRGALFDLFPMGSSVPYRIDFFDNEIDTLRSFDIDTQRTLQNIEYINLLPAHEFPTNQHAIELFRSQWRELFEVRREAEHIYQQVSKGGLPAGIEYWQPLFFNEPLPTLLDHLPNNTLLVCTAQLEEAAQRFWQEIERRFASKKLDPMRPLLPPEHLWLSNQALFKLFKQWPKVVLHHAPLIDKARNTNLDYQSLPSLKAVAQSQQPLSALQHFIQHFQGAVIFLAESEGRREALLDLFTPMHLSTTIIQSLHQVKENGCYVMLGYCEQGFIDCTRNWAVIGENDLLGERISQKTRDTRKTVNPDTLIRNLAELQVGQPVVHLEHGVGRYGGLITLSTGGVTAEYVVLNYAGADKLYVPVSSLYLISRYLGGAEESAPLHKLGTDTWSRTRQKAADKARDIAAELLDIYAHRATKQGVAFKPHDEEYQLFCQSFPFETTPDQEKAINAVLNDMYQPYPMDRLICGDVGFGKTEVAMRAAFIAVINHKQVTILVPTTLLAQQHYENFRDRFAQWPIRIEMISRFRTKKQQHTILEETQEGKVDILIGTHKLLQTGLQWHDLGLLIIDEEHRFGVRQKEQIKALRSNIDILTLTATPIPRTLNMAVHGIRDLSIIATPPARRLSVKTFVREYDPLVIREALLRETLRGGQVYYLYNDVKHIDKISTRLAELVPEARIIVAHGQMRERELERVMMDFHHQRYNVLVCTTIIETGIDIPSVNTIIIERSDRFGLAQLHQLRGRVGRSHHQAYAYLLTPHPKEMTADAHKRLNAIATLEDLGAGFALATHDLEIRGAGELLGDEQSGQMINIGFSLYMDLLENAVDALKKGQEPSLEELTRQQTEIELRLPSLLPETFIPDVNTRLSFYKRIASSKNCSELEEVKIELIDRFGLLPSPSRYLLKIAELRQQAQSLGIKRIDANERGGFIEFGAHHHVNPNYLIQLLQQEPTQFRLEGADKLKFIMPLTEYQVRLDYIEQLLAQFSTHYLAT